MKKIFIQKMTEGGIDWHDIKLITKQLSFNSSFEIPKGEENKVITEDIVTLFPYVNHEELEKAIETKTTIEFDTTGGKETFLSFDGETKKLQIEYMMGQICYTSQYFIEEIEENDIGYLVGEHFYAPTKGVPLVERIYHVPFTSLDEAKRYFEEMKLHSDFDSNKEILVISIKKVKETIWLKENIEAIQLMEEKNQTPFDKTFSIDSRSHLENLVSL